MLCFVKRRTGDVHEPLLILQSPSSNTFGDVCADAVRRADKLRTDGITVKAVPFNNDIPDLVS